MLKWLEITTFKYIKSACHQLKFINSLSLWISLIYIYLKRCLVRSLSLLIRANITTDQQENFPALTSRSKRENTELYLGRRCHLDRPVKAKKTGPWQVSGGRTTRRKQSRPKRNLRDLRVRGIAKTNFFGSGCRALHCIWFYFPKFRVLTVRKYT